MQVKIYILILLGLSFINVKANNNQENTQNNTSADLGSIINRIPRNYDKDTLINSAPGLLQEALTIFKRRKQTNTATKVEETESTDLEKTDPLGKIERPEITSFPREEDLIDKTKPILMLPAPRPGFIIRYNQERKVYEEVREIKIPEISPIEIN